MHLKPTNWLREWKSFSSRVGPPESLQEATPAFVGGTNRWIDTITDGGEYTLNEVLPFDDLFDGKMRAVIPAISEDDEKLAKIVQALKSDGWKIPIQADAGTSRLFPISYVKQKKRREGGEVYETEEPIAKLNVSRQTSRTIPKGPRAGEVTFKTDNTTMSRAINKATKADSDVPSYISPELAEWWQKNQTFYTKGGNQKKIQTLFNSADSDVNKLGAEDVIIVSRHPIDVLRMGDVETPEGIGHAGKIGHCHREGGEYARCAQQEALGHGPIAYLVKKKDLDYLLSGEDSQERRDNWAADKEPKLDISDFDNKEIFSDKQRDIEGIKATNRVRLRQFANQKNNNQWAIPEKAVYPSFDSVPGFRKAVADWAWKEQKEQYEDSYGEGEFPAFEDLTRFGGSYEDHRDGSLLNDFFARTGVENPYLDMEGSNVDYTAEESEELDPNPEEIAEQWDFRVQESMDIINQRMDHSSVYGEVELWDEERPYVLMSADMTIPFNEDLFGYEAGAEYELPDEWRQLREFSEIVEEAFSNYDYIHYDELDISTFANTVTFNFRIPQQEDYDPTPEGFDEFARWVEDNWDNAYAELRKILKRILIQEKYMAPDAYEKLAQSLRDKAAERDENDVAPYRHWDFDEDGGEIVFMLKSPKATSRTPDFKGIRLGEIPSGMDLRSVVVDWKYNDSKLFNEMFIPQIRALFAEAENAAAKQLTLPGVESEELHGLLLPERAKFRLMQQFTGGYSEPATIYLQIKMEIDEEVTDEQIEEIEYFLRYLDKDSSMKIIEEAGVDTFKVFLAPAIARNKLAAKVEKFVQNIQAPLLNVSYKDLFKLGFFLLGNPANVEDGAHIQHSLKVQERNIELSLGSIAALGSGQQPESNVKMIEVGQELFAEATPNIIDKAHELLTQSEPWDQRFVKALKLLGIELGGSLQAGDRQEHATQYQLTQLHRMSAELTTAILDIIREAIRSALKDPTGPGSKPRIGRILNPHRFAPDWWSEELSQAGIKTRDVDDFIPSRTPKQELTDLLDMMMQESTSSILAKIDKALR